MEERLLSKFSQELKMNKADLVFGDLTYQYVFLLLKGLDDTSELYLVYAKSNGEVFEFRQLPGLKYGDLRTVIRTILSLQERKQWQYSMKTS